MNDPGTFAPLVRFHLRVGARLALRAAAPLVAVPVIALLVQNDPSGALRATATWLLAPPGRREGGLAVGLVGLALAGWAAPRVTSGLGGWLRHMPVTDLTHRRAALVALVMAQASVVAALLLLAPFAAHPSGGIALRRLAALPVTVVAAALAAWPGQRPWRSRPLALLALLFVAPGELAGILVAIALVIAAERLAGPLAGAGSSRRPRRSLPLPAPLLIGARALGFAALGAPLAALLPVAAMALLCANNDLSPAVAAGAARLGGGLGTVIVLSLLAERLAERRPPWPWARSLPIGATRRVGQDALLMALPCLVPLAAGAGLDAVAALTAAACLPTLALRASAALRHSGERGGAAGGRVLAEGALLAGWVAVLPWLALLALAAAPIAWWAAAADDRRQKVSRWDELHHQAVGDSLEWSAR